MNPSLLALTAATNKAYASVVHADRDGEQIDKSLIPIIQSKIATELDMVEELLLRHHASSELKDRHFTLLEYQSNLEDLETLDKPSHNMAKTSSLSSSSSSSLSSSSSTSSSVKKWPRGGERDLGKDPEDEDVGATLLSSVIVGPKTRKSVMKPTSSPTKQPPPAPKHVSPKSTPKQSSVSSSPNSSSTKQPPSPKQATPKRSATKKKKKRSGQRAHFDWDDTYEMVKLRHERGASRWPEIFATLQQRKLCLRVSTPRQLENHFKALYRTSSKVYRELVKPQDDPADLADDATTEQVIDATNEYAEKQRERNGERKEVLEWLKKIRQSESIDSTENDETEEQKFARLEQEAKEKKAAGESRFAKSMNAMEQEAKTKEQAVRVIMEACSRLQRQQKKDDNQRDVIMNVVFLGFEYRFQKMPQFLSQLAQLRGQWNTLCAMESEAQHHDEEETIPFQDLADEERDEEEDEEEEEEADL